MIIIKTKEDSRIPVSNDHDRVHLATSVQIQSRSKEELKQELSALVEALDTDDEVYELLLDVLEEHEERMKGDRS